MDPFLLDLAADEMRTIKCAPYPARWLDFHQHYPLVWNFIPFAEANHAQVPDQAGIYCFFVGLPPSSLPPVGYPLYVGKTERTLRQRFIEYISEEDHDTGRVRVRKFLKVFQGELHFAAAAFQGTHDEIMTLETAAMEALMPVYSDLGFKAETRAKRSAWQ
ncbi:hypothetical protein [Mesorhizobium sp.]|uniref:hypothetical protein n=1 Tax=Mesorhizobium sp. TaxID=1871066 RepID=UPI001227E777|nr:hypothetical protein [Mesorhizobium sp.]TIL65609.1 MAG: hypothetical protein E5Y77_20710 [Mesorhizobium sp.]